MADHRIRHRIIPTHQDLDTDPKVMKPGAVRYARNGRRGTSNNQSQQVWENIRSTAEIAYALPVGDNVCIGAKEDKKYKRVVFFIWNSNDNHGIYCYLKNENIIVPVYLDTPNNIILCLDKYHKIQGTRCVILDGRHMFWTDRYNSPRYLDIEKAIEHNKKKIWYVAETTDNIITTINDVNYSFKLTNIPQQVIDLLHIEACDCKYIFTEKTAASVTIAAQSFIPQNFYPKPHVERQLDMILYPPHTAPTIKLKQDPNFKRNFVTGFTWQFRNRIKYKNGAYSQWGPWSKLINTSGKAVAHYNSIEVNYSAKIFNEFNDNSEFNVIDSVEIGYRNTNKGQLAKVVTIPQCEIPRPVQKFIFFNDKHAEIRPSIEDVMQYDSVPLLAGTLNLSNDVIMCGDVTEGYNVDCDDFQLKIDFTKKVENKTATLRTKIFIENLIKGSNQPIARYAGSSGPDGTDQNFTSTVFGGYPNFDNFYNPDKYDQYLPDGGWYGYLRGTGFFGLSKQVHLPGAVYYNADREIIDLTTTDNKLAFATARAEHGGVWSVLEIHDIPYGTYIFTLASHLCSEPVAGVDKLNYGKYYNVENDVFQKTSTQIFGIRENGTLQIGVREYVVTIDDTTVVNGIVEIPDFIVEDVTVESHPVNADARVLLCGYVLDKDGFNGGNTTLAEVAEGTPVELADFKAVYDGAYHGGADFETNFKRTDHNGFYYSKGLLDDVTVSTAKIHTTVRELTMPDVDFINTSEKVYKGRLTSIYDGTAEEATNNNIHVDPTSVNHINIPNYNPNVSKFNRTHITGRIIDQNGSGIKGMTVVLTETNRFQQTDDFGNFDIVVYVKSGTQSRNIKMIIFDNDYSITVSFSVSDYIIQRFKYDFNDTTPYDIGDIKIQVQDFSQTFNLKNGGTYAIAMNYLDRGNRKSRPLYNEKKHIVRLPFTTEKVQKYFPTLTADTNNIPIDSSTVADGVFSITVIPKSKPPIWATHAFVLRSEDQIYSEYVQMVVSEVKYVENYEITPATDTTAEAPDPVYTSFGTSTAAEVYLDLTTSFVQYQYRNTDSVKAWSFQKGDRLRFIYDKNGNTRDFIEVEIRGQRGNYFVIPVVENMSEILKGEIVEVFRLKQKRQSLVLYEIAEHIKIDNPYTEARNFHVSSLLLNTGDAYRRNRKMYAKGKDSGSDTVTTNIVIAQIEDQSPADNYLEADNDIGRPDEINDNNIQQSRPAAIRFGEKYLLDSNLNNLHTFIATNIVEANRDFGRITVLEDFGNLIFVAQQDKCHTRYINKQRAILGDGKTLVLDADEFINRPEYLSLDNGCSNPESYCRTGSGGKFFDSRRGAMIQYSPQNGDVNISGTDPRYKTSKNQDNYFIPISQIVGKIPTKVLDKTFFAYAGFMRVPAEYFISFEGVDRKQDDNYSFLNGKGINSNIGDDDEKFATYDDIFQSEDVILQADTSCYNDTYNEWMGSRSYIPECYARLDNYYFGFKNGKFYMMENGADCMSFFGTKYKQKLIIVGNMNPGDLKDHGAFSIESTHRWSNPKNIIPYNSLVGRQQESRTPDSKIRGYNHVFNGPFLKDELTANVQYPLLNGKDLIGEVILMEIENDSNQFVQLFSVNILSQPVLRGSI